MHTTWNYSCLLERSNFHTCQSEKVFYLFSDGVMLTTQSLEAILKLKNLVWLGVSRCYSIPPVSFR